MIDTVLPHNSEHQRRLRRQRQQLKRLFFPSEQRGPDGLNVDGYNAAP
jgi:hypothetical protein